MRTVAAAILAEAQCEEGDDLRLVAAGLGIPLWLAYGGFVPGAYYSPGRGIVRPLGLSFDEDQRQIARCLAHWVGHQLGVELPEKYVDEIERGLLRQSAFGPPALPGSAA